MSYFGQFISWGLAIIAIGFLIQLIRRDEDEIFGTLVIQGGTVVFLLSLILDACSVHT